MATFTSKLGDEFLKVPRLSSNGRNWIIYKDRLKLSITARGLESYLEGTSVKPTPPQPVTAADGAITQPAQADLEAYRESLQDWTLKEAIVLQQIASTIPDSLYLKIKGKGTVKEAWDTLKHDFEVRSRMFTIDMRRKMQEEYCEESGDVRTHFDTMRTMREDLATLGDTISDTDFTAMLLGSLPKSYDTYLSAITATMSVLKQTLDPDALMMSVTDEYDRRNVKTQESKRKGKDVAFHAGGRSRGPKYKGAGSKLSLECFNCHKKGHKKADCWAKGGGKEGQWPKSKRIDKSSRNSANSADDEDGVWLALADGYAEEKLADIDRQEDLDLLATRKNYGDNYWLLDDEYGFSDDENVESDVPTAIGATGDEDDDLPALLTASDSSDEEDDLPDLQEVLDTLDDEEDDLRAPQNKDNATDGKSKHLGKDLMELFEYWNQDKYDSMLELLEDTSLSNKEETAQIEEVPIWNNGEHTEDHGHDNTGSKLEGRSRIGHWIGFDEASNAHRIYWDEKRTVTIERSVKFDDGDVWVPGSVLSKGEKSSTGQNNSQAPISMNQAPISTNQTPIATGSTNQPSSSILSASNPTPLVNDPLGDDFDRTHEETTSGRSQRLRKPSGYVKRLQDGTGVSDGRPSQPNMPRGLQTVKDTEASAEVADIQGELSGMEKIEYEMAAAVSEAEAMDPMSLDEAKHRTDWPKWEEAIQVELNALKKAGTWRIVEKPKERNIVESKWVLHIKKDAAGNIERYKARLVAKGFTQVQGVDYYETFAPVAKLASIRAVLAIANRNGWPIDMFD